MTRLPAVALAILLCAPIAAAHLQGARPIFQRVERNRIVDLQPEGLALTTELSLQGEPLRHFVSHEILPTLGEFSVEYREDASIAGDAFRAAWDVGRLVEYRDANTNGRFEASIDGAAKVWRFTAYRWTVAPLQRVQVGGVEGFSVVFTGNLTGAPQIRLEVAVAGLEFDDEGVRVRPQDVAIYLDFLDLPQRGVGHLYAFEWDVTVPASARFVMHTVEETPTALVAVADFQTAIFLWGGEALIDGAETRYFATITEERETDSGNRTAKLLLHLPTADESLRFAFVSGIEYGSEARRQPLGWEIALLALAAAAFRATGRRRRA